MNIPDGFTLREYQIDAIESYGNRFCAYRIIISAEDIQDTLKNLLSGTIQDMLETEMDNHLGYDRYERCGEPNYHNGT